jgi:hypothetical protein
MMQIGDGKSFTTFKLMSTRSAPAINCLWERWMVVTDLLYASSTPGVAELVVRAFFAGADLGATSRTGAGREPSVPANVLASLMHARASGNRCNQTSVPAPQGTFNNMLLVFNLQFSEYAPKISVTMLSLQLDIRLGI